MIEAVNEVMHPTVQLQVVISYIYQMQRQREQPTIGDYYPAKKRCIDDELVLLIADMFLPFSLASNPLFKLMMNEAGIGDICHSETTLRRVQLKKTNKKVMDFVKNQLSGREVCLIVDEMTRFDIHYYNFLLSCPSDKVTTGTEGRSTAVYFWTSKILHEGTAERIGSMIGEVICELQQEGINVTSYATDNCSVMRKTEQYVQRFVLRPIQRVACASHVLNGIFKDLLKLDPIKEVWNNVLFLSLFHIGL